MRQLVLIGRTNIDCHWRFGQRGINRSVKRIGHNCGGIWRIPFVGAFYVPNRMLERYGWFPSQDDVSGLSQIGETQLYITGGLNQFYPKIPFISDSVAIFGVNTKMVTLITPVLTIVLVIALVLLINKTKIGMAMRAVSKDFETSQLMGIKINNVISVTFIIGSFLAGVGSILYFTSYNTVIQTSGAMPGLKAFVAAVFGGIGSIPGAVVGAFIIGICENLIKGLDIILFKAGITTTSYGLATFSDAFTFALLIIILIVKPTGLFGEKITDKV